jgi:hypothetical protein
VSGPDPRTTADLVAQHVERIHAQERAQALEALEPSTEGFAESLEE